MINSLRKSVVILLCLMLAVGLLPLAFVSLAAYLATVWSLVWAVLIGVVLAWWVEN